LINIPCQKSTPDRKLRKYPIKEIGPFVFIWMGEEADFTRLPNLPHLTEPEYQYIHGSFDINGSYLMMTENLYDLTHFPYLHANTFNFDDSYLDVDRNVKKTSDNLVSLLNVEDNPEGVLKMLPPQLGKALSKTGVLLKTTDETIAPAPGIVKVHQMVWADDKNIAVTST
jgi:phenylpropionate dioxygenase-like ring-hydroxylating dioxygenase large terminal subunit